MYYFTKNWLAALTAVVFMFGSVFAQELSPQEKERMDKAAYELEMQSYQPKMVVEEVEDGFMVTGEGAEVLGTASWGNYYYNQRAQTLYKKEELGGVRMLMKSIAWNFERIPTDSLKRFWKNVSIKLKEVELDEMPTTQFVDMTDATEVYTVETLDGPSESGWFTIDIDDFSYSGKKNLIMEIKWGNNGYWTGTYFRAYKTNPANGNRVYGEKFDDGAISVVNSTMVENLKIEMEELPEEETTYNIEPKLYDFAPVGILNGEAYGVQDTACFKIRNLGPGTINIVEAPTLFSEDADQFEIITDATFPRPVEGPYLTTNDMYKFGVKFNPTSAGEKHTLLVVKDDMGRVVRTYPISGTAYTILDGDIMENAIEINQNWPEEADYTAEGNFEGYYHDYDVLGENPDKVYKFTTVQDSYFTLLNVEGLEDIALYAEGEDFTVENNLYDGGQAEIGIGTFYVVIAGTEDYAFTMHVEGRDPIFEITPTSLDLGEVPIGAFHYGGKFVLRNAGGQSITINNVTVSDEEGVFEVEGHYEYPFELTTQEMVFYVHCNATVTGTFTANLLVDEEGATTHIYPITATTYVPEEGDVAENPFDITVEGDFSHNVSLVNPPMRKNYMETTESLTDVVYHFTFEEDKVLDINTERPGYEFFEDFENGYPSGWTFVDADGDGYNWIQINNLNTDAHSGSTVMTSGSYINGVGPVNPDNYLITPKFLVDGNSVLKFWMIAQDHAWPGDKVYVEVSTTTADPSAFTALGDAYVTTGEYVQHEVDLSAYAGQEIYVAFHHTDSYNKYFVNIDDVEVTSSRMLQETTYSAVPQSDLLPFKSKGMTQEEIATKLATYQDRDEEEMPVDYNGLIRIYSANDLRVINPTVVEPVAEGTSFEGLKLWKGEYYMILSGEQTDYVVNISETTMPDPAQIVLVAPENGDNNVVLDPVLEWEQANEYTQYIDVYLDTQYPPVHKVVSNGNPADTMYQATNLAPAQIYFWKVVAKNGNATIESEIRAFTTTLPPPILVAGSIVDFDNVHLTWQSPFAGEMLFVEDFEGGELPEGWEESTLAEGNTAGWRFGDDLSSQYFNIPPHTIYAAANDDEGGDGSDGSQDYLITRSYNFSAGETARLSFESYYPGDYGQLAHVKISVNQGEWQLVQDLTPSAGWTNVEIDLSEYAAPENTDVRILFHSDDDGQWGSGWAIDDVVVGVGVPNDFEGVNATLLGYNVYQNGEKLNNELVTVLEYDVNDLPLGDYIFGVSAVYPQGESEIITIDEISILGRGMVEGTVTDADTQAGIANANMTFTAKGMEGIVYETTTDENGHYTIEVPVVVEGYDAEAAASGYQPNVQEVMAVATQTVTLDFVLGDIPVPVPSVVAEVVNEQTAKVYWGMGGSSGSGDEFSEDFENGLPADWTLIDNDGDGDEWFFSDNPQFNAHSGVGHMTSASWTGSALTPDNYLITPKVALGASSLLKFWIVAQDPNYPGDKVIVKVSTTTTEPSAFTQVGEAYPAPATYEQKEVDLSAYAGQEVYIAFVHTDCTDFFRVNLDDVELTNGRQVNAPATTYYQAQATAAIPFKTAGMNQAQIDEQMALYKANQTVKTREFKSYSIYRTVYDATAEMPEYNWELLADNLTDTVYMDNTWGDLANGAYKYAVKSVYTVTESELALSNRVIKGMFSDVFVFVNLNTGESSEGAEVTLTGAEFDSVYTATVGTQGNAHFPAVWVGTYSMTVAKEGFMTAYVDTRFENPTEHRTVELEEALCMPVNLMANTDCTDVTLSWELDNCAAGDVAGDEFTEDFENGLPTDWMVIDADGDGYNWENRTEFTAHSGVGVMASASFVNNVGPVTPDNYLITPQIAIGSASVLKFWMVAQDPNWPGDKVKVKVSTTTTDPSAFTEVATFETTPEYVQQEVDLSAYAGQQVYIAFNHVDCTDKFYVNIDDVEVTSGRQVNAPATTYAQAQTEAIPFRTSEMSAYEINTKLAEYTANQTRSLTGYKVYRDGTLLTSEPITEATYTDDAVPAGTHNYTVMAVYSTGNSEMSEAVEVVIEEMLPVEELSAEKIGNSNIRVFWDGTSSGGGTGEEQTYTIQLDDGTNADAIGLTSGGSFDVAAKFSTSAIQNYNGMELRKIAFFPYAQATFVIKVWQGEGTPTLVYEQAVPSVTDGQWNEVTLNTPVVIDASQALWIGYNVTHDAGAFPAGCDAGPNVAGGDMINLDGWSPISTLGSFDFNWNLAGTIVGTRGEELPLVQYPALDNTLPANPQGATLANKGEAADALSYAEMFGMSRALTGYKLYRKIGTGDFTLVAGNIAADATQYFDQNLTETGDYVYHLVSVYNNSCESATSNETAPIHITIGTEDLTEGLNVYPNPVNNVLTVEVNKEVSNIVIVSQLGQVVYTNSNVNTDKLAINVRNFANGTYIIKFMNDERSIANKRFVVVK